MWLPCFIGSSFLWVFGDTFSPSLTRLLEIEVEVVDILT